MDALNAFVSAVPWLAKSIYIATVFKSQYEQQVKISLVEI